MYNGLESPQPHDADEIPALPDRRATIAHHMAALEDLADPAARTDGWTLNADRWFLQAVAESGGQSFVGASRHRSKSDEGNYPPGRGGVKCSRSP